ncbi:MAG: OmpA family protein [Cyclobacteriaceae bacterium]
MKYLFAFTLTLIYYSISAQVNSDVFIRLDGEVLSTKDSSFVEGVSLSYEKLPYYDDMGIGKSKALGKFEFYLIQGKKYAFRAKKAGFIDKEFEMEVTDDDENGFTSYQFYLEAEPEEPELELITLDNLIFARGSAQITESSFTELDNLVNWLDERPSLVIQLEGHTDFAGNDEANMRLSEARVTSVKEYLLDKGVKKNRVLTKAFGGTQPLSQDRTDEAKIKNRRVEVRVISR